MGEGWIPEVVIIFLSGIGGAALMTFFLNVINAFIKHGVRVPLILGQVVHHYFNGYSFYQVRHKNKFGHGIHLSVGVFFSFCYAWLWHLGIGGNNPKDILLFGVINGLVGIVGWYIFLKTTYEPEQVEEKIFFPVLIIAHIVFAWGVTVIYFTLWYLWADFNG
jgi:uncharacterized membrane protein